MSSETLLILKPTNLKDAEEKYNIGILRESIQNVNHHFINKTYLYYAND